jgi:hypothetical protein
MGGIRVVGCTTIVYQSVLLSNIFRLIPVVVIVFMLVPFNNFLLAYLLQISQLLPFADIEVLNARRLDMPADINFFSFFFLKKAKKKRKLIYETKKVEESFPLEENMLKKIRE